MPARAMWRKAVPCVRCPDGRSIACPFLDSIKPEHAQLPAAPLPEYPGETQRRFCSKNSAPASRKWSRKRDGSMRFRLLADLRADGRCLCEADQRECDDVVGSIACCPALGRLPPCGSAGRLIPSGETIRARQLCGSSRASTATSLQPQDAFGRGPAV